MGGAKYFEDDMDFMFERQSTLREQTVTEVVYTTTPLTEFFVVVEHNPTVSNPGKTKGKTIVCRDCGHTFSFSIKAQKHYAKKQWSDPKRCKCCRDAQRNAKACTTIC